MSGHWHRDIADLLGHEPRFVVFCSYGNDSVALIQWAHEQELGDLVVVYSDTGWSAPWWRQRVDELEKWVHSLSFWTSRTQSIGFVELARRKKAFPTQRYQWCSYILKIEPAARWLRVNDPQARAVCLVGVRREEGPDRASFPTFLLRSGNHGNRVMVAPFAEMAEADRDQLLRRAGVEPLPHRSMECSPCINSNKSDILALTETSIRDVERLEAEMQGEFGLTRNGKPRTFFRPHRHGGAVGIREVVKWANSKRGAYRPADPEPEDDLPDENLGGWDTFGGCG